MATPEELAAAAAAAQAERAAAAAQRFETDRSFLIRIGQALETEVTRLRNLGEDPMSPEDAAAFLLSLKE